MWPQTVGRTWEWRAVGVTWVPRSLAIIPALRWCGRQSCGQEHRLRPACPAPCRHLLAGCPVQAPLAEFVGQKVSLEDRGSLDFQPHRMVSTHLSLLSSVINPEADTECSTESPERRARRQTGLEPWGRRDSTAAGRVPPPTQEEKGTQAWHFLILPSSRRRPRGLIPHMKYGVPFHKQL